MFCLGDFAAAEECVGKEETSLEKMTQTVHITLPAGYFGKIKSSIALVLNNKLQLYCTQMEGMPVAFNRQRVKLLSPYGKIIAAQSCIHFDVETDYIVFKPKVNDTLQGVVNKHLRNTSMVGCLVHGVFYVGVNLNGIHQPGIGDEILLTVTKIEHDGHGYLAITGKMEKLLRANPVGKRKEIDSGIDDEETGSHLPSSPDHIIPPSQPDPAPIEDIVDKPKKKKSKEKKLKKKEKKEKKKAKKEEKRLKKEKKSGNHQEIEPWPTAGVDARCIDSKGSVKQSDLNDPLPVDVNNPVDYSSIDEAIDNVISGVRENVPALKEVSPVEKAIDNVLSTNVPSKEQVTTEVLNSEAEKSPNNRNLPLTQIAVSENVEKTIISEEYSSVDEAIDSVLATYDVQVKSEKQSAEEVTLGPDLFKTTESPLSTMVVSDKTMVTADSSEEITSSDHVKVSSPKPAKKTSKKRKLNNPSNEMLETKSPKKAKIEVNFEPKSEKDIAMAYLAKMGIKVDLENQIVIDSETPKKRKKKKSKKSKHVEPI